MACEMEASTQETSTFEFGTTATPRTKGIVDTHQTQKPLQEQNGQKN